MTQNLLFQNHQTVNTRKFPVLFVKDSKGKLRSWEIFIEPRETGVAVVGLSGLVDGAKVKNEYVVTAGRNIGRTNETTPFEQAYLEAKSKWDAQIRSGYVENQADAKQSTLGSGIAAPMLAKIYSPDGRVKGSKTLEKLKILGEIVHVQPKLDGNRCLAKITAHGVELYTRKGDRFLPIPHIERQLASNYKYACKNGEEFIIDGELYTDKFSFNTLNGLLRREEKTDEHLAMLAEVNYHIYDLMSTDFYARRHEILKQFRNTHVRLVPSNSCLATDTEIRKFMEIYLAQGYEGLMIRNLTTAYENKRSWSLLKYKDFQDAEYRVVDILEDVRGTGIIGAFVLELEKPLTDRDGKEIKTFNAGIKNLSHDEARKILANKQDYLGKIATVEFFEKSEYGIPRFPKLKGFRMDV